MKTKGIFLTLLLMFFGGYVIFAANVPVEKAKTVAKNLYFERASEFSKIDYNNISIADVINFPSNTNPLCYIINISNNGGYVIISADDRAYPVLAYSFQGNYNAKTFPPAFFELMDEYTEQLTEIQQKNLASTPEITGAWQTYSTGHFSKGLVTTLGPLVKTHWDQGDFYNDSCPGGSVTGCVATMMAQLMKYWAFPTHGQGSHSYTSNYGLLSVNFANATYKWSAMPYEVTSPNAEVAKLMYHCGVSVDMNYSPYGSGANTDMAASALQVYFKYANSTAAQQKSNFSSIQWEILIRANLINNRPVGYAGGNHAFICDGFQYPDHFHFNFGWGGLSDGYFYLNNINPNNNYSSGARAITGCYPNPLFTDNINSPQNGNVITQDPSLRVANNAGTDNSLGIYPNPNNGKFKLGIINDQNEQSINLTIRDVSGKIVKTIPVIVTGDIYTEDIDVSDLPQGFYILTTEGTGERVVQKFIIK